MAQLAYYALPDEPARPGSRPDPWRTAQVDEVIAADLAAFRLRHPSVAWEGDLHCPDVRAAMHAQWLSRLLHHLMRNALDALEGRAGPVVRVSTAHDGLRVVIEVADNGKGVRPEIQHLLFRRPIAHDDPARGRGRGLLLAHFLAEQHGGTVILSSNRPGKGACFRLTIPAVPPELRRAVQRAPTLPRVLVLDDEEDLRRDVKEMLTPENFEVSAPPIGGLHAVEQARALAREHRPHVIILDLRLSSHFTDDRTGLDILEKLPDTPVILYSNWPTVEITRLAQARHDDVTCIGKMEPPDELVTAVTRAARRVCAARHGLRLSAGPQCRPAEVIAALFPEKPELPPGMIEDLLHRLFPESKAMTAVRISATHPDSAPASRGHSVVCKVIPDGLAPFVVKFGPAEKIEREASRYDRHVHDRLGDRFYGAMNGRATFWDIGAASYRFMGANSPRLCTFTEFYEREDDPELLLRPLRHFFVELWGPHYRARSTPWHSPLYESYNRALRLQTRLKDPALRRHVAEALAGCDGDLPDPLLWLDAHREESELPGIRHAITHGDLHGDNLFVDGDHAWAIDFERTGPGHVLRDFAELEVDLLTRLAPVPLEDPAAALAFYRAASGLIPGDPLAGRGGWAETGEGRKALVMLSELRRLEREVTGCRRTSEQLWSLLFDAAFLLSLAPPAGPQWQRALLLSATLCRQIEAAARG